MHTDLITALLIGLGTSTLLLGAAVAGLSRLIGGRREPAPQDWMGTVGVVSTAIPEGGVGVIAHHRNGPRAALAAQMYDGLEARAGDEVVVIEVRHGVARVVCMD